jgi:uncharacterized protein YkwD
MTLYVLALGGTLFLMLGAGVTIIEASSTALDRGRNVTTITTSESPAGSAGSAENTTESPAPSSSPSPILSEATAVKDKITAMEDAVTELINKERVGRCNSALRTDERLRNAARAHSADMAKNNYFSHNSRDGSSFVDRIVRAGYPKMSAASENIAAGHLSAKAVVQGWMTSDGHRRNILDCQARAVGVGLAYRGDKPYWTQDFGRS